MKPRLAVSATATTMLLGSLAGTANAALTDKPVVFHQSASGKTVSAIDGDVFKVSLKACGDCGDHWEFARRPSSDILKVTHRKTVSEAPPGAVGGNNHTVWTFKVVGDGTTRMRLVERTARNHNQVIDHFNLKIVSR